MQLIKKMIPKTVFRALQPMYHYVLNFCAAVWYGFPSEKMIVIGVTGTTGKTTVTYLLAKTLEHAGLRVGYTSTAMFHDGKKEWLNDKKMTMLGRFFTQKMLRTMVANGCDIAIVETTSEGAVQYRHRFINYDIMLFTGLYPEHIDAHGSFDNYKKAKQRLFAHLSRSANKKRCARSIVKTIIVNGDDEHAQDFLDFDVPRKMVFTKKNENTYEHAEHVHYACDGMNAVGTQMHIDDTAIQLHILGSFNATNAAAAASACRAVGIDLRTIKKGLESVRALPGRLERIDEGQVFTIIVDYAFEPVALRTLYDTVRVIEPRRIIHVLGATGGGRDAARRRENGVIAGENADIVIVTDEDPYDDDPVTIMRAVADGAASCGKKERDTLFLIEDRAQAIAKAVQLARAQDLVLITGKGCEQAIAIKNGAHIPWDDRRVAREAVKDIL